jgi:hypothetical protein
LRKTNAPTSIAANATRLDIAEDRAKAKDIDQWLGDGVERQAAGEQQRHAFGNRQHAERHDKRRDGKADDDRAVSQSEHEAGQNHDHQGAGETGMRQHQNADDAGAGHD